MRHYPGLNHTNIASLYLSEVRALQKYVEDEAAAIDKALGRMSG